MVFGSAEERRALLKAALQMEPDDPACEACLDSLAEFVDTQLSGGDYLTRFREVLVHLDACGECAAAYARLYELAQADAAGELPQPDRIPAPDLGFLLPGSLGRLSPGELKARLRASTLVERFRSAVRRAGDRLTFQFSPDLLAALRPAEGLAALRAPMDSERYGERLFSLEPGEALRSELPITVQAYRDAEDPQSCLVEVTVEPAGMSWPDLGGVKIELVAGEVRREGATDAWGLASFPGVLISDLEDMTLEVVFP